MRLFFLTSRLPYPPNRGDRLRVYNFIRSLSRKHEIHLISFIADEAEHRYIVSLKEYCQQVDVLPMSTMHSALAVGFNIWRRQPLQALYYRSATMQALVDRVIATTKFDLVYVHLFRMAPYVAPYNQLYRIVDLTDVISQELIRSMPYRGLLSKLLYALERPRIERYERWVARYFDETWLISNYDQAVLSADCPKANIQVVRNGVDTNKFYPTGETGKPNSLIMVGHMGVFHNVDAANYLVREILPRIRPHFPDVTVKIVGASPNSKVRSLASFPGVEVTGFVDDLNSALNLATIFVAPLRFAAGVQNKVLEAMAAGRPVVTTSLVNQGLGAQPGSELLIADTSEEISAAILRLLTDNQLRSKLGKAGMLFVQQNYRWDLVSERIRTIQENLL